MAEIFDFDPVAGNNNDAPPNGFPEFMEYEEVNDAGRELMAVIARFYQGSLSGVKVTAGTGTAYTLVSGQTFAAYAAGQMFAFVAHTSSTGPCTLNVDAKGAGALLDSRGIQMGTGGAADIVASGIYFVLRTASAFRVVGHLSASSIATLGNVGARTPLSANATYYVRADGNDANTGLVDSAGGAFLTVQRAIDIVYGTLDLKGFDVTIQVRSGTFARAVIAAPQVGKGSITLQGDAGTPANVVLAATGIGANTGVIDVRNGGTLIVKDLTLQTTTTGDAIYADHLGQVYFSNIRFATTAGNHINLRSGGAAEATGNYSIVGNATRHFSASNWSFLRVNSRTVTITGTPAFSDAFVVVDNVGVANINGNTWSGSATGKRFTASSNGVIQDSGGATALPGNAAGTIDTGGRHPAFNYQASDAEIYAATTGEEKYFTAGRVESASALVTATDAATIAIDWDAGINRIVTLTANRVLGNPTNGQPGTYRTVLVLGNDATLRTLTFGNQYFGSLPVITNASNTVYWLVTIYCVTATHFVPTAVRAL